MIEKDRTAENMESKNSSSGCQTDNQKETREKNADVNEDSNIEKNESQEDVEKKDDSTKKGFFKKNNKKPDEKIKALEEALASEKDRVLRLSAELDNYKKRSARELADFKKFANESLIKRLLAVVDNLERAVSTGSENKAENKVIEGVNLTLKEMLKLFDQFNVKPVKAEGEPFDPAFHQAVTQAESSDHPENTVITELQKGYLLNDRLIRPSMVIVSKAPEKKDAENSDCSEK
ncbi:MAG: nucleotide exchange factor GrpE [Thermodesulfobacteriota bacterium]|nr:nucleotide exchange factor GrpE [Thermodesulfobacteriota bacterium]